MKLIEYLSRFQVYVLILVYILIYTYNLDKYPRIWWDEALWSNPAYTLLTKGKFGTEIEYGWYNIHNNTFWMHPASLLLLFPSFKIFGFGILQARGVSVVLGLVSLIFAYKLAERLYNRNAAFFSSILLIFNPINFWINREVRPESALIAFLLIAVYSFIIAQSSNSKRYYFLSGIFASLGFLSHPNGLLGIIAIFLIMAVKKIYDIKLWYFVTGILLPGIVYLVYVLSDFDSYIAQTTHIRGSATTILQNIIQEYQRYKGFIGIYGQGFLENDITFYTKLAFFTILFSLLIIYTAKRCSESDKLLMFFIITYLIMFTVLIRQKIWWYLGIILPYVSILMASVFMDTPRSKFSKVFKLLVAVFLLINIIHISFSLYITRDYDYSDSIMRLKEIIPSNATVLGAGELWIGMPEYKFYDYTTIMMRMKNEKFMDIIRDLRPDYVIVEDNWRNPATESMWEFRNVTYDFLEKNSTKIASIPYRSSLTARTPLEIYKIK